MGGIVESQIRRALDALASGDRALADEVITNDQRVKRHGGLPRRRLQPGHRQAPAGGERLRLILAITKTVTDLERIGDEAQKIARMAKSIHERGADGRGPRAVEVRHAAEVALSMLRRAPRRVRAPRRLGRHRRDPRRRGDRQASFRSMLRQLITYMMEDPRNHLDRARDRVGGEGDRADRRPRQEHGRAGDLHRQGTDIRHIDPARIERELADAEERAQ